MNKKSYELQVLVNGKPVKEYSHNGKVYIEGKKGSEFSLRIKNNNSSRILAVPTADGLSVLNGKDASLDSPGYVIDGYDSLTIDGWRKSVQEVARFYFSSPEDSYRKRSEKGDNVGIIGLAVFREKEEDIKDKGILDKMPYVPYVPTPNIYPVIYPHPNCSHNWGPTVTYLSNNNVISSMSLDSTDQVEQVNMVRQDLGTGWGEAKKSEVTTVTFEREDTVDALFEIIYNTRKRLEELGVDFDSKPIYVAPQSFPGEYCAPPKN